MHICGPDGNERTRSPDAARARRARRAIRLESFTPPGRSGHRPDRHRSWRTSTAVPLYGARASWRQPVAHRRPSLGHVRPIRQIESWSPRSRQCSKPRKTWASTSRYDCRSGICGQCKTGSLPVTSHGRARCPRPRRSGQQRDSELPGTVRRSSGGRGVNCRNSATATSSGSLTNGG